jgi:signal transduction histidine kinase
VEVGDTGLGFSVLEVPVERLGVRVSIIERVAKAGGSVEVESTPGAGTVIDIRWPRRRDDLPERGKR